MELLFFAYRDFVSEPDAILQEYSFGRAHHRVLHFVDRYPGLKVAQLLEILKITKQSLARVLRQLIEQGFIEQRRGLADGRERLLHTTPSGHALAQRLLRPQLERVAQALAEGDAAKEQIERFLSGMITGTERARVFDLLGGPASQTGVKEGKE